MIIERRFGSYNDRRYGKPWGARITFPDGIRPKYDFAGHWDGTSVVINAEAGEVLAFGQKDHRGKHHENRWYIVQADGTLEETTEPQARRYLTAAVRPPAGEGDVSPGDEGEKS
jgi:hypothetical protein